MRRILQGVIVAVSASASMHYESIIVVVIACVVFGISLGNLIWVAGQWDDGASVDATIGHSTRSTGG